MRAATAIVLALVLAACGPEQAAPTSTALAVLPAVVLAADGTEIARFSGSGFVAVEPELEQVLNQADAPTASLATGGLVLDTAIDVDLQAHVRSVLAAVPPLGEGLVAGVVVLERSTGAIRALALSDFGESPGGLDALVGAGRATGSALKPLALAAALDSGQTLDTLYPAPECIEIPDAPGDQTCGGTGEQTTLLEATVASLNPVFIQVIDTIGVQRLGELAADLGIASGGAFTTVDSVLGTYPVSVIQMAGAYRAIAEGGSYIEPRLLLSSDATERQVLAPHIWADVDHALAQVVERGTGVLADPGFPVAGKTGTAREFTDAWFVGYAEDVVAAVWVGFADDRTKAMVFPATATTITGGSVAAELWSEIVAVEPKSDGAELSLVGTGD
jgi:penicillin-binding protein 1A